MLLLRTMQVVKQGPHVPSTWVEVLKQSPRQIGKWRELSAGAVDWCYKVYLGAVGRDNEVWVHRQVLWVGATECSWMDTMECNG